MAGRGTDIILGGNLEYKISNKLVDFLFRYSDLKSKKEWLYHLFFLVRNKNFKNVSQKFLSSFISLINETEFQQFINNSSTIDLQVTSKCNEI